MSCANCDECAVCARDNLENETLVEQLLLELDEARKEYEWCKHKLESMEKSYEEGMYRFKCLTNKLAAAEALLAEWVAWGRWCETEYNADGLENWPPMPKEKLPCEGRE